jgi:ATP-dependent Clp protease ATP-binding subunit ClpC
MLLTGKGLRLPSFDPSLAAVLGATKGEEGFRVVAEAIEYGHPRVELRDWLYCLAKTPGTLVHSHLVDALGKTPDSFVGLVESSHEVVDDAVPPGSLTQETAAPEVLSLLARAEEIVSQNGKLRVDEATLTLALLETADIELISLLEAWYTPEGMERFRALLQRESSPAKPLPPLFLENGALNRQALSKSGHSLMKRLAEDAASLGAHKITGRHLLYTLLGNESGALSVALAVHGLEPLAEMHAVLTRELARPGKKRNDAFTLTKDTLFGTVRQVFEHAQRLAMDRGAEAMAEQDAQRAMAEREPGEITRLVPPGKILDMQSLTEFLRGIEPEDEEGADSPLNFSIPEIEARVNNTIFGQTGAVARIIPWVKRLRFGIPRDNRPAAVFLFLGPTGAGKTQLAKELARYVFGDPERLIFLEMGQFKTKESMSMFVGAPPGYIGYGEGKLTNGLRDKPESVVLFDEIEKADPQVFDTLLRFADEGMISDPAGPVRDGRKCILVMTTNAGQRWLRDEVRANPAVRENPAALTGRLFDAAMKELAQGGFRPEFLGRVDERITFLPFTVSVCRQIVDAVLAKETGKFKELKGVEIEVGEACRNLMAKSAHARSMDEGARGAPRVVNQWIVTPAIDILSDFQEKELPLPQKLVAVKMGAEDIVLEALA